ncbi:MAG: hypothetical protein ONB30_10455 [candidate division KSB1 bacterium]|nr:hypothetical protein [candidate division KSB1 bacterium]
MRRSSLVPAGLLILSLGVVILLVHYLRTFEKRAALRSQEPSVPSGSVVEVRGQYFYDTIDGLSFKVPPEGWQMQLLRRPDSLPPENPARTVLSNVVPLVVAHKSTAGDTLAAVTVGVLWQTIPRDAYDCAVRALGELIAEYERGHSRVRLLKEVTVTGKGTNAGAYFMVVLPEKARESMPVWVVSVSVRDFLACFFLAKTSEVAYPGVRSDIERIVESFRWL